MGKIRLLSQEVVRHIAAGEVIDRPASVLKELLENALDAGATRIEVEIQGGGIERISVSDNGCGMDAEDAALSLTAHATSKMASLSDLLQISTHGFRGEALASIAAVSRLELLTRPAERLDGTKVVVEGGAIQPIEPAGLPLGTRVIVRDLFFNVPARRKFLKSTQTEEGACLDLFSKITLSRCDVAFQCKKNGKIFLSLPEGESLKDRYLKLFPQTEENQLFSLESIKSSMKLSGLIGGPLFPRASRSGILFYLNKRVVRPGVLIQAVLDGYSGYLQAGKFPVIALFLEVDGQDVDVNVHPSKAEVRFSRPREVYAFVEQSIALRLQELNEEVRPRVAFYPVSSEAKFKPPVEYARFSPRAEALTFFEKAVPYKVEEKKSLLLGSVAKTYALFQEGDTLFLVDLHVAHERINFEILESRLKNKERPAQELLIPLMVSLSASQSALAVKYREFFYKLGMEVEEFGERTIRVSTVPAGLERLGERDCFLSLLDQLTKADGEREEGAIQYKILAMMACRSSIQAGDEVSNPEMESIFEKLLQTQNPYFCPHGRPVIIKLTLDEVHRLFRRK